MSSALCPSLRHDYSALLLQQGNSHRWTVWIPGAFVSHKQCRPLWVVGRSLPTPEPVSDNSDSMSQARQNVPHISLIYGSKFTNYALNESPSTWEDFMFFQFIPSLKINIPTSRGVQRPRRIHIRKYKNPSPMSRGILLKSQETFL